MPMIRHAPYLGANLQHQVNRLLDQFDSDVFGQSEELGGGMFAPAVDVKEDADNYTVHMEVPGVTQDQLQITLQENVLTIRGQKQPRQEQAEGQFRRVERVYGSFARSLTLPRHVDGGAVNASLDDGVLTVRLPKREEARPRQISIAASGGGQSQVPG